jgi:hypothetical protein
MKMNSCFNAELYKDNLETLWKNRVFNIIGINNVLWKKFHVVKESNKIQRKEWLQEASEIVDQFFPKQ